MAILFDEHIPHKFVKGLSIMEESNKKSPIQAKVIHPYDFDVDAGGDDDEDLIKLAGKHKATIISFDKDFKHQKHYYQLYKANNVGIVLFKLKKHATYWDQVLRVMNSWETLKEVIHNEQRPFAFQYTTGFQRLSF